MDENQSDRTRMNLFYEYGPSWLQASDRWHSHPSFAETLPREQRIILRSYTHPNFLFKPPAGDVPLYALEEEERFIEGPHVPVDLRRRLTRLERKGWI